MKTKEFIKIMEDAGLCADVTDTKIRIRKEDESAYWTLAIVSKEQQFRLGTESNAFDRQSLETKAFILDNLYKYASTPISERESIGLLPAERVILENISHDYKRIRLDGGGVLTLEDYYGTEYDFCMFGKLFDWVKNDEVYEIYDLLNG